MEITKTPQISVVSPVYGCKTCLYELHSQLKKTLEKISIDFEIILVNDASPDNAWEIIVELAKKDNRVKGINLSRNFGQHYAITAGLDHCQGEWVVVMDCDLQDQPKEIIKLYDKALAGYDVILASRCQRTDSWLRKIFSNWFTKIYSYFTETHWDNTISNFGMYRRKVILNYLKMREHNRAFPIFVRWLGFNTTSVEVEHGARYAGKSSYNFGKMLNLAIESIVSQSNKPLRLTIKIGFFISFVSFFIGLLFIFKYVFFGISIVGWASTMVSIWFVAGLVFANFGIFGLYLGKVFDETKNRPLYVISETMNIED